MFTKPVSTGRPTNINTHSDTHTHAGTPSKIKKLHQKGEGFHDKVDYAWFTYSGNVYSIFKCVENVGNKIKNMKQWFKWNHV